MIAYFIAVLLLVLNIIYPRGLWYFKFWRFAGKKTEPSKTYILYNRMLSVFGIVILTIANFSTFFGQ